MFRFWLLLSSKPNSALFGLPTGRSLLSLRTPTRGHRSNLTVGTLFSNSRLVSLYQPLRFSKFWDLRSWHLGLARIKHALVASLLVMIRTHVHDVLLLRRRKNAPLVRTNVLLPHHPLPLQLRFRLLRMLRIWKRTLRPPTLLLS